MSFPGGFTSISLSLALQQNLDTFTCFEKLPLELYCKAWHENIPGSSAIETLFERGQRRFKTDAEFPIVLHICREAGTEALKTYES